MKNYETIDKYHTALEKYGAQASMLEWCVLQKDKLTPEEYRLFGILLEHGKDFSRTPHLFLGRRFAKKEYRKIPKGACHIKSFKFLHNMILTNPNSFPKLYWGYCDQFVGGKWVGAIKHSFVVFKDYAGQDVLFDMYADVKYAYHKRNIFYTTYFGIPIPAHFLYSVWGMAENPNEGGNFSSYLMKNVFISDEETEKFEKMLIKEAELSASFLYPHRLLNYWWYDETIWNRSSLKDFIRSVE